MLCLSTGFEVALRWLWCGFVLRSLCLVYAYYMALGWLWVACRPSLFKVRGWTFDVRHSASGRNLNHRKAAFCPSAVSLAYTTRPGGGRSRSRESESYLRRVSGECPVRVRRVPDESPRLPQPVWLMQLRPRRRVPIQDTLGRRQPAPRRRGPELQAIQRTFHSAAALAQHMRVDHRRGNIVMPQQFLDGPDVRPALEGMGRKTMSERMAADLFGDAHAGNGQLDGVVDGPFIHVVAAGYSRTRVRRQISRRENMLPRPFPSRSRVFAVQCAR